MFSFRSRKQKSDLKNAAPKVKKIDERISSDEVPQKLVEWLLGMGYPAEKAPTVDQISEMCRGQFYMVWRSLIEHVHPKEEIRKKRLKVFCDDVVLCQKKNVLEQDSSIVPEQLLLWRQHEELKRKVADAEDRVMQARKTLGQLNDKVSNRMYQRDMSRKKVEDRQRRVWLLRQVAADLNAKKTSLDETRAIANSLCSNTQDDCLQGNIEKCVSALRGEGAGGASLSLLAGNPVASSSVVSTQGDDLEDLLSSLARAPGAALWTQLCERRAALHATLATVYTPTAPEYRSKTHLVLAHTANLHIKLSLDTLKHRALVKRAHEKIAARLEDINDYISGAACEQLVSRCERASAEARVRSLRTLLDELTSNTGVFQTDRVSGEPVSEKHISAVDKSIESTRDKLQRLIVAMAATERKTQSIKEALNFVFISLHNETPIDRYRDIQMNFPQESIATIRQFYKEKHTQRQDSSELSLNLNSPEKTLDDTTDVSNPKFIDELKMFLKKFYLEKNRKFVLENGQKLWIFETLQSSIERNSKWLNKDGSHLLCPSASLTRNIQRIVSDKQTKEMLEHIIKDLGCEGMGKLDIDLIAKKEQEAAAKDKIKKQISENLLNLQQSTKLLEVCQNNLQIWHDDVIKTWISTNRTVDGKTYRQYESAYTEALMFEP